MVFFIFVKIQFMPNHHHFLIYKPYGYLSQFIYELKRPKKLLGELYNFPEGTMAIGRLDEDSEGLLLLTTDGMMSEIVRSKTIEKEYYAQVDGIAKFVLQLSARKFDWMVNKNLDSLAQVLHPNVQYIHSNGLTESRSDILENLSSGKLQLISVTIKNADVRIVNQLAIVTGTGTFVGKINEKDFEVELLYSEVWVFVEGQWLLLQRHANRVG
jgi:23S rRNA pseudouridine2457 synthase